MSSVDSLVTISHLISAGRHCHDTLSVFLSSRILFIMLKHFNICVFLTIALFRRVNNSFV
ncbi:MPPV-324 ankyrin repeat protein [Magpiepox virus 2]|nr:MPPV-324 ankyrin repeat protein [Magpiepox virus 2]